MGSKKLSKQLYKAETSEELVRYRIGGMIRILRNAREVTLRQLSKEAGLSISLISQIERSESSASLASWFSCCRALGVRPWMMLLLAETGIDEAGARQNWDEFKKFLAACQAANVRVPALLPNTAIEKEVNPVD